ncbi:pre-rRNA-processing protein ipi1 [Hyalella azteca]|uniref:Pre-rRNA-processing protein ipi1 n=2 Tax=Hyalella azteca TaxID=294128 RepID=A0A979FMC5_HYAAZ|nr:pre-rRNA-processing protein ipi1 [Hyalella azteca]
MAKSQRSKREKQKDFVKKKVKVGKTLQKPQNETITTFKTRSILILEQLAEKEAGSNVTKKRYTLSELCSRLGQKNPNQKLDACQGINELFGKLSSEQTRLGLSSLMPALCPCLLDDDSKVRTTTIQLFELLIDKVGCSSMRSHFTLLGRHASCGLVSLHSDVQASALQLLHVLLRKTPQLLPLHAPTILPNLLRLLGAKTKSGVSLQKVFTEGIGGNLSVPNPLKKLNNSTNDKKDKKDKKEKASKGEEDMVVMPGEMSSKHNSLLWQLDVLVLVSGLLQHHTSRSVDSRPMGRWQMLLESCRTTTTGAGGGMGALGDGVAHTSSASLLCHPTRLRTVCLTVMTMVQSLWCSFVPHTTSKQSGGVVAWFHALTVEVFGALLSCHFPFHYADLAHGGKAKNKCTYEARPQLSCDDLNINVATVAVQFRLFDARHSHSLVQYIQGESELTTPTQSLLGAVHSG